MIQLAFEPAYDPFHAAFRFLRHAVFRAGRPVAISRAKILDVYLAEPNKCLNIRLSGKFKAAARRAAKCQHEIYGHRPPPQSLYNRMSIMQDAAIQTLVLQGLLDGDAFGAGQLRLGEMNLPQRLHARINEINGNQEELVRFLFVDLDEISFDGIQGLKDRTGLGEFRYDIV